MDALGIQKASLVGHSLGARVCLEVARQARRRVAGLVLTAPMGFGRLTYLGMALGTATWALFNAVRRPLPYPRLDVKLTDPELARLDGFDTPTLVLWGKWDPYFSSAYAKRVQDAIPDSQLRLFGLSGHSPHRRQPGAFNRAVVGFLSTLDAEISLYGSIRRHRSTST
jgi:esterase